MNAKAGDTAEIQLSDAFEIVTTPEKPIMVESINVGTSQVIDGVLKFVFNDNIETSDVHNGYVDLRLEFNLEKFRENIEQEIPFHDGSDQNITVVARPNLEHSGIEKEGHADTQHDAREITWTIDVINTNDEEITGATLADNIPEGLGEARDFVIHELSVDYDGDIREGADVTTTLNPSQFPIELGTVAPFNGYRVQYTTTIENYAAESFTNDATFEYGETSLPADATVGGLTRSNPIEKDGWQVGDDDIIHWQIDVNKNGSLINEAIVEDNLPAGLTIDPDSIEVVRITQTGGNWVEGDPHEDEDSFIGFEINLGSLGQEDAYRIKFETTVNWEEVNDSEYQQNNGFENETTLYDGEDELNDDDATVTIVRDPILRKVGADNVDYDNKTVTWTIHVNEAGHPIGNVVLTDLIPEGLAITEGDIVITDEEGNDYTPDSINLDPNADGGTEVVIDLGDVGTRQLKVEYTTEITDFTINNFNNGVGMTGVGIGPEGENSNATIRPEANVYGKSFEGIDYNAKTIDWQLNVNPRREAIASLTIEDTFPNKGMILLPDTVEVNFAGEELEEGTDYTLAPRTEDGETGYHKGFTITILDNALPLDGGQLLVGYQTSYDPQRVVNGNTLDLYEPNVGDDDNNTDRLYVNRAHYTGTTVNDNDIDQTRDASKKVREDSWNSGKKEGQLVHFDDEDSVVNGWESGSERKIAWQFYFNYQEQNLGTGVVVTDELAYAGNIDEESIQVSVYDVATDGETTITDNVLDSENYSLDTDEDGKFILTFADGFEVTERYVVEFTTSVPDISKENYTNNATVTASGIDYKYSATLNYKEYEDFLNKRAVNLDGNRVFTGDEVDWQATVNESLSIIKKAVITDTISAGHVYLEESLEVYKAQDLENALEKDSDYTLDVAPVLDENEEPTGETNLIIKMSTDLEDTVVLKYKTVVTETDGEIGNSISLDGTAIDQQLVESDRVNARQFSSVGGEWAPNRGALKVMKVDGDVNQVIENNEATFTLWYDLNGEKQQFGEEEYTTEKGILEIGNLPLRTYYLREIVAPNGYVRSTEDLEIVVDTGIGKNPDAYHYAEATFENIKEKIEVTGIKKWINGPMPSIQLQLFRDGEKFGDPVDLENNETEYTWENLDRTDIAGNEYKYTVDEVEVPENYNKSISDDGLTITNEFETPLIDISVKKRWEDSNNQDNVRPDSIKVELLANGEATEYDNLILYAKDDWLGEFVDLPEFDNDGNEISYSVKEIADDSDYESDVTGNQEDGFVITNSYTPEVTEVSITKEWIDEDNLAGFRPDHIEVELYADGNATGKIINIVADEDGVWEGSFINLPKYRDKGTQIKYSIQEVNISKDLYSVDMVFGEKDEEGFVYDFALINTHIVERINLEGTKTWDDADNQDGVRPESITVRLQANGEEVEVIEVTAETEWAFEFTNLPKFADGEEINYTIQEVDVKDYSTEIDGMNITNSYTPGQTSINVVKSWDDVQDKDGIRPDSITVKLFANGKDTGQELVLTAKNNWQGDFTELDEYSDGKLIEYTIEEVAVDGYESTITGASEDGFVITNTHTPEEPETPVDPEDPEKPEEETPGDTDPEDPADSDDDSDLPNAGEAATYTLLALVLVGLGFGLRYYGKRRTN